MTPAQLEQYVLQAAIAAWVDLTEQNLADCGDATLRDTAISITPERTRITIYANYRNGHRTLSAGFSLPEPLPWEPDIAEVAEEIQAGAREGNGPWRKLPHGGFIQALHDFLEGQGPAPKLFVEDETLH